MKKTLLAALLLPLAALAVDGSRDNSGNFSYAVTPTRAGNVVTTLTPISSAWANQSFLDVKLALTDSLSRTGKGGMSAPLSLYDSGGDTLDLYWAGASTTGLYHSSGTVGLKTAGTARQTWAAALTTITTPLTVSGGNVIVSGGNMVLPTYDLDIQSAGGIFSRAGDQAIAKTGGGNLYVSHAVAGGNVIFTTPISVGGVAAARMTISGTNTIDMTVPLTMGNQLISNVLSPVALTDVATKGYVDTLISPTAGAASWTTSGSTLYAKHRGIVFVRGSVNFAGGNCTDCATLNAGSRPGATTPIFLSNGGYLSLATSGAITRVSGADGTLTILPFSFIAEN